jgi:transposase
MTPESGLYFQEATMIRDKIESKDDGWRIPDELWERIKILLPPSPPHPLGCHKPPTDSRKVMDAIFFVLRTGVQWNSLSLCGFISSSTAHRWFQRWLQAGVFHELWKMILEEYDDSIGIDWSWLSMDGSMVKSPLGGEDTGPNPTDRGKKRDQAKPALRRQRDSAGSRDRRGKRA